MLGVSHSTLLLPHLLIHCHCHSLTLIRQIGKNYTFDKRFCHGAKNAEVVSFCVVCNAPWENYQAQMKCIRCRMEVLVCRTCQRNKKEKPISKASLICPLCKPNDKGIVLKPPPKKQHAEKGPGKSTEGY